MITYASTSNIFSSKWAKSSLIFFLSDRYNYIKNLHLEVPAFEANVHLNSIQIKYI